MSPTQPLTLEVLGSQERGDEEPERHGPEEPDRDEQDVDGGFREEADAARSRPLLLGDPGRLLGLASAVAMVGPSLRNRRMFRVRIGTTGTKMKTAIAEPTPRPLEPAERGAGGRELENGCIVLHGPGRNRDNDVEDLEDIHQHASRRPRSGRVPGEARVTRRKTCHWVPPSVAALRGPGARCQAARPAAITTIANPAQIQKRR